MTKSKLRGHDIEHINGQWVFSDTKESTVETHKIRPCGNCGKHSIKEGHEEYDACIGKLPGLMNACCGHGVDSEAYVQFLDGFTVCGKDAKVIQEILKRWRDNEKL